MDSVSRTFLSSLDSLNPFLYLSGFPNTWLRCSWSRVPIFLDITFTILNLSLGAEMFSTVFNISVKAILLTPQAKKRVKQASNKAMITLLLILLTKLFLETLLM